MGRVRCEDLGEVLAGLADGGELPDRRTARHVEGCLRCQAELAQHRKLLKALRTLRTEVLTPAPGLVAEVLATLEEAGERAAVRSLLQGRRVAYLAALAAAGTAAAAGAGVAVFMARRGRPGTTGRSRPRQPLRSFPSRLAS